MTTTLTIQERVRDRLAQTRAAMQGHDSWNTDSCLHPPKSPLWLAWMAGFHLIENEGGCTCWMIGCAHVRHEDAGAEVDVRLMDGPYRYVVRFDGPALDRITYEKIAL